MENSDKNCVICGSPLGKEKRKYCSEACYFKSIQTLARERKLKHHLARCSA